MEKPKKRDAHGRPPDEGGTLRRRAEALLGKEPTTPAGIRPRHQSLAQELSVHKVELELQNEELVRAGHEAEEARQRYYDLFDRAPVAYVTLDRKGCLVEMNLTAARLLRQPRGELIGRPLLVQMTAKDRYLFADFLFAIFTSEGRKTCEVALAPSGVSATSQVFVRIEGFQVAPESGKAPVCRAVLLDITEQKQAVEALRTSEEATRRANEELELKVAERTAELTRLVNSLQEEVQQRIRAEADLTAAHGQLKIRAQQLRALAGEITRAEQRERLRIATILHDDLQQLLAAARLQVTLLGRGGREPVRQGAVEVVGLLEQCLATTRSLTSELHPTVLHLEGLEAAVEWVARLMAEKHGLHVDVTVEDNIPVLAEDLKILLFEAARELLFNVVKHAQVNSAALRLRCTAGSSLELTVSDSGRGFDPQKPMATGKEGGGFGLVGLRERLGLIGGALDIDSAHGKGSRITLTVPLGLSFVEARPPAVFEPEPETAPVAWNGMIRVLLADDHAVIRAGLARLLGLEPDLEIVGQAADGQEAIELANLHRPDVILMDVRMPVLDGIAATQAIHATHPHIRIIGLSMYDEAEHTHAMRAAGAVAFVSKNEAAANLLATIRESAGHNPTNNS